MSLYILLTSKYFGILFTEYAMRTSTIFILLQDIYLMMISFSLSLSFKQLSKFISVILFQ